MAEAEKLLARRQVELGLGVPIDPATKRTTFADLKNLLRDHYENEGHRSLKRLDVSLARLEQFFGNYRARNITYDVIERYKRNRREQGAARSTVNSELRALSKAFKLAKRANLSAQIPPIDRFGMLDNSRKRFFEEADVVGPQYLTWPAPGSSVVLVRAANLRGTVADSHGEWACDRSY